MTHDWYLCRIQKACHASETMTQTICVKEGAVASKVREALREPSNTNEEKNFFQNVNKKPSSGVKHPEAGVMTPVWSGSHIFRSV